MTLKDELKDYQSRWSLVEAVIQAERRSASPGDRWRQVNSAFAMAKGLGLIKPDATEKEVFEVWARLKERSTNQNQKI
jgi:hypothetical protein